MYDNVLMTPLNGKLSNLLTVQTPFWFEAIIIRLEHVIITNQFYVFNVSYGNGASVINLSTQRSVLTIGYIPLIYVLYMFTS